MKKETKWLRTQLASHLYVQEVAANDFLYL